MSYKNRAIQIGGNERTVGSTFVRAVEYDKDGDVFRCSGTTVPTGTGYAKGCLFVKTDAASGTKALYENQGTNTVASFNLVGDIGDAEISMSDGNAIDDNNANELLQFEVTASAVNHVGVKNAATGNSPIILAKGESDTGLIFQSEDDEEMLILDAVAGAVNEVTIRSAATGTNPILASTGEADTGLEFHNDQAEEGLILDYVATAVNEVTIANAIASSGPEIQATGDDTNIDIEMVPKGTGNVSAITGDFETATETVTTGSPTLAVYGSTQMDSSGGAITGTLGSGTFIGQIKTIVMTEASNSSTISITNHETSDPEVATFDAVDETGVFLWSGTEWVTLFATCTFV